jgi:multidrug efflux system outer membrane protein
MAFAKKDVRNSLFSRIFVKKTLLVTLGLVLTLNPLGASAEVSKGTVTANSNTVVINPESLRVMLLEQNIDLAIQLNNVYKAKTQVSISRSRLLPSINLGAMLSGPQGFALSSITTLLPFLLPSNWLNIQQSQHLVDAQVQSYYISQLNTYSSAYSLYLTVVGDQNLRDVLYKQYVNFKEIEDLIQLAVDAGMMNEDQLLQARAQTQLSNIQVSQLDVLLIQEKASIREMLSLPLTKEIVFQSEHMMASPNESLPLTTLLERANKKSPELVQLESLVSAAKVGKWSAAFGFLTGASLSSSRSNGAFDVMPQSGSLNLGFSIFPQLKLGDYNIDAIRLQKTQVTLDQAQMIETAIGSLKEANKQYELALAAEKNLQLFYDGEVEKFKAGMTDLLHVLNAGKSLTTALTNKVNAQIQLDTLRVSLNRILIEGNFTKVKVCEVKQRTGNTFFDRMGRVLGFEDNLGLDKACGPQTKN